MSKPDINAELLKFRDQIDDIDQQVLFLLNKRASLAQSIGHVKAKSDAPVMRPEREAQVLDKLNAANQGPLSAQHVNVLFKEIMSACRSLEREVHVAFLGPLGTYSEQAVWSFFATACRPNQFKPLRKHFASCKRSKLISQWCLLKIPRKARLPERWMLWLNRTPWCAGKCSLQFTTSCFVKPAP